MLEVVGFYFDSLGQLIERTYGSVYIVPGVSLLAFIIAAALMMLFISLLKLHFTDSLSAYTHFEGSYEPKHVYHGKHIKGINKESYTSYSGRHVRNDRLSRTDVYNYRHGK